VHLRLLPPLRTNGRDGARAAGHVMEVHAVAQGRDCGRVHQREIFLIMSADDVNTAEYVRRPTNRDLVGGGGLGIG
jgi:hypothetical protein